ncbi:hypothetical protein PPERSA_11092 [Pseudocohnilembus persalinus]|uniref:Uncharacterized protein n=1 Tax=Pseudocohnilembus persalinus TaxID=266149 RepID=A0A0V0QZ15_PSEPJ|nr:hypothetical protein PPERSA_11092 [Pseudocohnilembus persalinus]|eukprot:KRX07543.1 hypothetical protein PPERSA_11092 [Pseudocohnilembus persalinus]
MNSPLLNQRIKILKLRKNLKQQNFDNLDYNQKIIFYPAEKNKVESIKVYVFQGKVEGQKKLGKIIYKNTEDKSHLCMDLELEPGDYTMVFKIKYIWEKVINKVDYEIHGLSQNCNIQIYTELINCYHDFGGF